MSFVRYSAKHAVLALMSLLISILILTGCLYFYAMLQLPNVETLKDKRMQTPLLIYSNDGLLMGEYGVMRRNYVTLDQVPKPLLQGIIATEDQRFFDHPGVDFIGMLRAIRELIVTGQRNQGASTITMQVARNFFLTPEKTYSRKIKEILLALKIDSSFSKETILELYINRIYLGARAYGVSAAAEIYFGKNLNELTLAEMAMIAGLPQAPSKENPITNPLAAKERRNHVLERMLELGYIDRKAYQTAIMEPVNAYYHGPKIMLSAPHVVEMVRNVVYQQFGEDGYTSGLQVYTTIDSHLQAAANDALRDGLVAYERRHAGYRGPEANLGKIPENFSTWQDALANFPNDNDLAPAAVLEVQARSVQAMLVNDQKITIEWPGLAWAHHADMRKVLKVGDVIRVDSQLNGQWQLVQRPKVQGAIVALNPDNGAILALNGGFNNTDSGFNRAVQANRQPGSSFKPFIYAAALAKGYTLATIVDDAPIAINDTGDPNNLWRPQNDDGQFHGPTRLRVGLVKSFNVMTVHLLQAIGIPYTIDYISQFGFERKSLPPSLSLALGTASVTPLQMATGYAVFANGGYRINPYFIQQILSADKKVLYKANPMTVPPDVPSSAFQQPIPPRVIDADIAYLITNALEGVIHYGTGIAASALKRDDIAGKTGTTQRMVDAWFSGFNRRIVSTVWVGYDYQTKSLGEHGSQAALPIWIDFMRAALEGKPEEALPEPPSIITTRINPTTGKLATDGEEDAILEVFRADSAPTDSGDITENANPDDSKPALPPEAQTPGSDYSEQPLF